MSLHNQIKKDRIQAMKNKDIITKEILSLVLGDLDTGIKNGSIPSELDEKGNPVASDDSVTALILKFRKNTLDNYKLTHTQEEVDNIDFNADSFDDAYLKEIQVYHRYVPVFISYGEIRSFVDKVFAEKEIKNPGMVIGLIKKQYNENAIDNAYVAKYTSQKMKR